MTIRINRNRDTTSKNIRTSSGQLVYDMDETLEVYDGKGNLIVNRKGEYSVPLGEDAQNIIYEIWSVRNKLHTLLMKHGIDLYEGKKYMSQKHAFTRLVKQCIAEVVVEPELPHEKWTDTFGNKIPGEFTVESNISKKNNEFKTFIKECVIEVLVENLSEGFDPQSNAGPNPAASEGTQENPYERWNSAMRKLEEHPELSETKYETESSPLKIS